MIRIVYGAIKALTWSRRFMLAMRIRPNVLGLEENLHSKLFAPTPNLRLDFIEIDNSSGLQEERTQLDLHDMLSGIFKMGVPKSKVSPSRKKMRHGSYLPDKVHHHTCPRCGEAKLQHRICTAHKEICAMREEDWLAKRAADEKEKAEKS